MQRHNPRVLGFRDVWRFGDFLWCRDAVGFMVVGFSMVQGFGV